MMACAVCSLWGKFGFIINFFNGGLGMVHCCPCLNVCVCGIGIISIMVSVVVSGVAATVNVTILA